MYIPSGLLKLTRNISPYTPFIPKSIKILFLAIQMFYGFNFGFGNCFGRFKFIVKIVTYLASVTVLSILLIPLVRLVPHYLWFAMYPLQYMVNFVTIWSSKYNVYDFLLEISNSGLEIEKKSQEIFGLLAMGYVITVFLVKYLIGINSCGYYNTDSACSNLYGISYYVFGPACLSIDTVSIVFIIIYYYIYCSIKKVHLITNSNSKVTDKRLQKLYKDLVDIYDRISPLYDKLITLELLFEVPKMMTRIYYCLQLFHLQAPLQPYITEGLHVSHMAFRVITPSVIVETVNAEVDGIILALHRRLLFEEDETKSEELQSMIRYIKSRPLKHKLWRIVPLDLNLPLALISMCMTYLIVVVQFTHLY